ncbi:MAG: hypothetical protein KDN19_09980 [Verrucomicrobiae bacterium]|nr:hypothetical protein [Verrucomicrobiae bacterium]
MTPHDQFRFRLLLAFVAAAVGLPLAIFLGFEMSGEPRGKAWLETFPGDAAGHSGKPGESANSPITLDPEAAADAEDESGERERADQLEQALLARLGLNGQGQVEGAGGEGIHRAVRHDGVWFPVFTLGSQGADAGGNDLPLYITSGSPPRYRVGEAIRYQFEAVGGAEPYQWRFEIDATGFAMDSDSGVFTGSSKTELAATLDVFVVDADGAEDSASYTLAIDEGLPLTIDTTELPDGRTGDDYTAQLAASGGLTPYRWSAPSALPEGFSLDEESGRLTGISSVGFDREVEFRVADAGGDEQSIRLPFRIASTLEFVTSRQLPPASPGSPYLQAFEVEGGLPPYEFRVAGGDLPLGSGGLTWNLSPDGVLEGLAPSLESTYHFTVEVVDSAGAMESKDFILPVRNLLTVVPSREKAGIAWSPGELSRQFGAAIAGVTVTRSESPDPTDPGTVVYQGTGSNFVDHGLATGGTYHYALYVHPADGRAPVTFGRASAQILPFVRGRATQGATADPFVDAVKVFRPLAAGGHGAAFLPLNVTGPPDGRGTYAPASAANEVLSLQARDADFSLPLDAAGGSVVLSFEDNIVELGPGEDFTIFENVFFISGDPNQRFMEPAIVSVALFEGEWFRFPIDVVPPAGPSSTPVEMDPFYYNRGFAGRNATTGGDPTKPSQSGGDSFDIDRLGISGLTWIRYIRIQSTGHQAIRDDFGGDPVRHIDMLGSISGEGSSGFDLDAVSAVNY